MSGHTPSSAHAVSMCGERGEARLSNEGYFDRYCTQVLLLAYLVVMNATIMFCSLNVSNQRS